MLKTFEKRQKIRNLTCVYAALKHILVDSLIILAYISDKTTLLSCHMFPWQQLFLSNCQNFLSRVGHFKTMQTQGKNESVSVFLQIPLHTC